MSWIRRETEKGTIQYICPRCHDYHEFREDFGERTFSENYIFCRRCGARNGTGNAPTLTPPNEWVSVENALPEECADILLCRKILKIPEIGTYQQARFWVYDEIGDVYQVDDVTHWLPIPTPYDIEHIHISEPPEGKKRSDKDGNAD